MEQCRVLLADTDLDYLAHIELLLLREYSSNIRLELVTSHEYLEQMFREPQKLDILVINECLWQPAFRRQDIRQIFLLSEEEQPKIQTEENDILLYKYTSARDVFSSINVVLRRFCGVTTAASTKTIMVYSPQGGSGKTTISMGICAGLTAIGSKVLFINTEALQTLEGYLPETSFMSDALLKQMISGSPTVQELQANIESGLFDYLVPMQYPSASYGVSESAYLPLIQLAVEQLHYDYVVVDCSCEFTAAKSQLMKAASFVVLPFTCSGSGLHKYRKLTQSINTSNRDKFLFIHNMYSEAFSAPDETVVFRPDFSIRTIPNLQETPATDLYKLQSCSDFTELTYRFL